MYDYRVSSASFGNGLNLWQFHGEVAADTTVVAGDETFMGVTKKEIPEVVCIHFDQEPPQATKDAVDALVSAHTPV